MQPRHGARITLRLERVDAERVTYGVELEIPGATQRGQAALALGDGSVDLEVRGAPGWLLDVARALLRNEWRSRRSGTVTAWPRRLTRWRAAPGDGSEMREEP